MKFKAMILGLLFSLNLAAGEQVLTLKSDMDGRPSFGIQYAYDQDFAWSFIFTTNISNQILTTLPNAIYWNIQDTKTGQLASSWTQTKKSTLMIGSIGISDRAILINLLPNLKTAKVVFGIKNSNGVIETQFSIPIGPLCQNYPDHFVDLTNSSKRACEVKAQDIPDNQSECKEMETELLDYVKKGILTCESAVKQYSKMGCGNLSCH